MLKLILADNQAIFRAGIAKVLAVEDEMRIVAQAQTPEQMFMALDKFRAAGFDRLRDGFLRLGRNGIEIGVGVASREICRSLRSRCAREALRRRG